MLIYIHEIVNNHLDASTVTSEKLYYNKSSVHYSIKAGDRLLDSSQDMNIRDSDTMQTIKDKIFKSYIDMVKEVE